MIYYPDWTQIPSSHLALGVMSVMWLLMHLTGPALMLATKIFCLSRYKVYRIHILLKVTKWIILGGIMIGWVIYGR